MLTETSGSPSTGSADVECILYTFLDIVAKSVFGLLICGARDGLDGALSKRNQALLNNA